MTSIGPSRTRIYGRFGEWSRRELGDIDGKPKVNERERMINRPYLSIAAFVMTANGKTAHASAIGNLKSAICNSREVKMSRTL